MCEIENRNSDEKPKRIIIRDEVRSTFERYRQLNATSKEACGVLIGRHSLDDTTITIDFATSPSRSDRRGIFNFKIFSNSHQSEVDKRFESSKREAVYLGTWHTHPEKIPTPSECDIRDWKKQFQRNEHLFDVMVFAIIGQELDCFWLIKHTEIIKTEPVSV